MLHHVLTTKELQSVPSGWDTLTAVPAAPTVRFPRELQLRGSCLRFSPLHQSSRLWWDPGHVTPNRASEHLRKQQAAVSPPYFLEEAKGGSLTSKIGHSTFISPV